ncbi:hypothetical protein AXZ95_2772 [Leifsonia sp. 115AMFTsu3.1]|nr:hypothetical protein AXZ95_2772 [Leifsonia sp. 115AMFTsu3.1]
MDVSEPGLQTLDGGELEHVSVARAKAATGSHAAVLRSKRGTLALSDEVGMTIQKQSHKWFWAATPKGVDLSWADVAVDAPYTVKRDGVAVATVAEPYFHDGAVTAGSEPVYEVSTTMPVPESEWTDADRAAVESGEGLPRTGAEWGLSVRVPTGESLSSMQAAATNFTTQVVSNATTTLRYTTFIRQPNVSSPLGGCTYTWPNHVYAGDNRGFSATSDAFRTRWDRVIEWYGSTPDHDNTWVGTTHVYDLNGNLIAQDTAAPNYLVGGGMGAEGYRMWDAYFDIRNPFCFAGSIRADFTASVYQSGSWSLSGSHRGAPDHEVYIKHSNTGWQTVYQLQALNFNCLVEVACARQPISSSGSL